MGLCLAPTLLWADPSVETQFQDLSQAIEAQGGSAQLYVKRARLALSHGDTTAALSDLKQAERIDPTLPDVPLRQGEAYLILGDWPKAQAAFEACLERQPGHVAALMGLAQSFEAQGNWQDASQAWEGAVKGAAVASPDPYLSWARSLAKSGLEAIPAALAVLEEAQSVLGTLPALEVYALELELELGALDAALRRLTSLIDGANRPEAFLAQRAQLLEDAAQNQAALTDYARALAAIQALPAPHRGQPRIQALEAQCRAGLIRLSTLPDPSTGEQK